MDWNSSSQPGLSAEDRDILGEPEGKMEGHRLSLSSFVNWSSCSVKGA